MSFISLACSSDGTRSLASLDEGQRGVVVSIVADPEDNDRSERLWSLGVTPGASITVLQTFPGVVFLCDQTELVVERSIARAIRVGSVEALS